MFQKYYKQSRDKNQEHKQKKSRTQNIIAIRDGSTSLYIPHGDGQDIVPQLAGLWAIADYCTRAAFLSFKPVEDLECRCIKHRHIAVLFDFDRLK